MKKRFAFIIVAAIILSLSGCGKLAREPGPEPVSPTQREDSDLDIPGTTAICNLLKLEPGNISVLNEADDEIIIGILEKNMDYQHFINVLEENGYQILEMRDATISSTFLFSKENIRIEMTMIDRELYKEAHIAEKPYLEEVTTEELLLTIYRTDSIINDKELTAEFACQLLDIKIEEVRILTEDENETIITWPGTTDSPDYHQYTERLHAKGYKGISNKKSNGSLAMIFEKDGIQAILTKITEPEDAHGGFTDELETELYFFTVTRGKTLYTSTNEFAEITLSIIADSLNPSGAAIIIKNTGDEPTIFGSYYCLEKLEESDWQPLPFITDDTIGWNDIGYTIGGDWQSSNSVHLEVQWEWLYGELEKGTYRMVKDFFFNEKSEDTYYVSAEFTID